jgi:plasmid stabilization system protein ParE
MISLSDDELAAVMEAARPIPARDRDQFLRDVADELARYPEIGPGVIHRVVGKLQREHLAPRRYAHSVGKWDR